MQGSVGHVIRVFRGFEVKPSGRIYNQSVYIFLVFRLSQIRNHSQSIFSRFSFSALVPREKIERKQLLSVNVLATVDDKSIFSCFSLHVRHQGILKHIRN